MLYKVFSPPGVAMLFGAILGLFLGVELAIVIGGWDTKVTNGLVYTWAWTCAFVAFILCWGRIWDLRSSSIKAASFARNTNLKILRKIEQLPAQILFWIK